MLTARCSPRPRRRWFRIGAVLESTDDLGNPVFEFVEGELDPGSGTFEATWRSRLQAVLDDQSLDCDLSYEVEAIETES